MKGKRKRDPYNIGKNIRRCRLDNELTQLQTVTKLQLRGIDMSRGTYSHIECGIDNIRVPELLALAEIFHVEVSEFFKGMRLQTDYDDQGGTHTNLSS